MDGWRSILVAWAVRFGQDKNSLFLYGVAQHQCDSVVALIAEKQKSRQRDFLCPAGTGAFSLFFILFGPPAWRLLF